VKSSLAIGNLSSPVIKQVLQVVALFQKQVSFEGCKYLEIIS